MCEPSGCGLQVRAAEEENAVLAQELSILRSTTVPRAEYDRAAEQVSAGLREACT